MKLLFSLLHFLKLINVTDLALRGAPIHESQFLPDNYVFDEDKPIPIVPTKGYQVNIPVGVLLFQSLHSTAKRITHLKYAHYLLLILDSLFYPLHFCCNQPVVLIYSFQIEIGSIFSRREIEVGLENPQQYSYFYRDNFYNNGLIHQPILLTVTEHINYIGGGSDEPFVVSVQFRTRKPFPTELKLMIRSRKVIQCSIFCNFIDGSPRNDTIYIQQN